MSIDKKLLPIKSTLLLYFTLISLRCSKQKGIKKRIVVWILSVDKESNNIGLTKSHLLQVLDRNNRQEKLKKNLFHNLYLAWSNLLNMDLIQKKEIKVNNIVYVERTSWQKIHIKIHILSSVIWWRVQWYLLQQT